MEKQLNPDSPIELEDHEIDRNDEDFQVDPWVNKHNKQPSVEAKGSSTLLHTEGKGETQETSAFHSGIGDHDDLLVKKPEEESIMLPFQYAARHRGRKKHETMIYPEIQFQYGIHYEGDMFRTDNEQPYDHRVDAYPGKTIKYSVTQKDPQPTNRPWEAQMDVHAKVRQDTFEYAVSWKGKAAKESVTGAADLFTSANGHFIGPGPTSTWRKSGNVVREIDNRSHASGIIAKEFYNWDDYEAEYEFKPIKATGIRNDPYAKVVTSDNRLVSMPGADNDVLGFIFKAKDRKNFYIFLWEGHNLCVSSWRPKSLNGYNMLTGNLTSSYTHTKAEKEYRKYMQDTNLSRLGISNFYSGMQLNSTQLSRYRDLERNYGWGTQHYRIYKVTNGVMREVSKSAYRGDGRGWRQDWFNMNWKNSIKVRCTGREVKIYVQSYKQGYYNENNWHLVAQFNVSSGFERGSVGLATFSQSVQFDKIKITRWDDIEGRIPANGWSKYKDPGSKQLASTGRAYVNSDAKAKAKAQTGLKNPDYEVTSVTGIAKDTSVGAISASASGPVTVKTYNPPDAGQIRVHSIIKKGTAFITPLQVSPNTAKVIFSSADEVFGNDLRTYLNKNPDLIFQHYELKINVPSNPLDDWDLEGELFTMWNSKPTVIETTKHFTDKVYAYQGWVESIDCRKEFDGLEWATYHLDVVDETINDMYDHIELKHEKVYIKTTEWYMGTYPADIKSDGIVTNEEHVFVDIPPMPEHYIEPNTGEVMYHGYEDVEFLLVQLKPSTTEEVWMGFKSNFENENTKITKGPINIINGRPVIKTKKIDDQVEIHCEERPRFEPWISGKYIGYGKVNGRRPFFKDGMGKADLIDVPTDVVFLPIDPEQATIEDLNNYGKAKHGYVYNLSLPIVEIDDDRVQFEYTNGGKTLRFWSDYMDAYVWYTDWYSEWKECETVYEVKSGEVLTIEDPIALDPTEDPHYDMADTIIDKFEVISTNPFVDVWAEEVKGEGIGFHGSYYQLPLLSDLVVESLQVTGDYREMIQHYTIKDYMTEVEIEIQTMEPFQIIEVIRNGEKLPQDETNGWTLDRNIVQLHGEAIQSGEIEIRYSLGSIDNVFTLQKQHGEDIQVYVNGNVLNPSDYTLEENQLTINKELLFIHDWVHIQSYMKHPQFNPEAKNYLGEYVGSRIDPEIWFDWGKGSPLADFGIQLSAFQMFAKLSERITFQHDLDMEVVYPDYEPIDITNFTGVWRQWDQEPVKKNYDEATGKWTDGMGDWHGPPEPGYTKVVNLINQAPYSGWYNPAHVDLTDYDFGFKVESQTTWDNDMYGAAFKWNPETMSGYTFEWDAGGAGVNGMAIYKVICTNPEAIGTSTKLNFEKTQLAHHPEWWDPNATGSTIPDREFYTHDVRISVIGRTIKVWTDGELKMIAEDPEPFEKGAWGPITRSNPETYFWDFWLQTYKRITPEDEPSFRKAMTYDIDRPLIDDNPMIEVKLQDDAGRLFKDALQSFLEEQQLTRDDLLSVEYYIRNDHNEYPLYFKSGGKTTMTTDDLADIYATVEGNEPPQSPPVEDALPIPEEPDVPPMDPPQPDPNDYFTVSWSGYIFAPETGFYEFDVQVDDGVRLWIDNYLLIDEWHESNGANYKATIYLEGGTWIPIKVNYVELEEDASIFLRWRRPNGLLERIDEKYISPYLGYQIKAEIKEETPLPWKPLVHNGYYYFHENEHYLYADKVKKKMRIHSREMMIHPRPKQGSPILIEKADGTVLRKVNFFDQDWKQTLRNTESFSGNGNQKYYLKYKDIDSNTVEVKLNHQVVTSYGWNQEESSITFDRAILPEDYIEVSYILNNSFYVDMNENVAEDQAKLVFHRYAELGEVTISYEGHNSSPFYRANGIVTNPVLSHNHKGFLYITNILDKEAKHVTINVSPKRLAVAGNEKVTVTAQVLDALDNPIPEKEVSIYRDGSLVYQGKTNEAGEVSFIDIPQVPEMKVSVYQVECEAIKNSCLLNFYEDSQTQRAYIELKAGKSAILAGTTDEAVVYATLRNETWYIVPNADIVFTYIDTHGEKHEVIAKTNSQGEARLTLSGINEKHGVIHITASYNMGFEHAKSSIYLNAIGG